MPSLTNSEFPCWMNHSFSFSITAFGINSILYQRGIYPPEIFTRVTHYDMSLQLTTDPKLKDYLTNVVSQLKGTSECLCFSAAFFPFHWVILCWFLRGRWNKETSFRRVTLGCCSLSFQQMLKFHYHQLLSNVCLLNLCQSTNQLIYLLSYICVHVAEWLFECTVQKLVLVITCLETNKVLERWQFDIECDKSAKERRSAPLNIHIEALESLRGSCFLRQLMSDTLTL